MRIRNKYEAMSATKNIAPKKFGYNSSIKIVQAQPIRRGESFQISETKRKTL